MPSDTPPVGYEYVFGKLNNKEGDPIYQVLRKTSNGRLIVRAVEGTTIAQGYKNVVKWIAIERNKNPDIITKNDAFDNFYVDNPQAQEIIAQYDPETIRYNDEDVLIQYRKTLTEQKEATTNIRTGTNFVKLYGGNKSTTMGDIYNLYKIENTEYGDVVALRNDRTGEILAMGRKEVGRWLYENYTQNTRNRNYYSMRQEVYDLASGTGTEFQNSQYDNDPQAWKDLRNRFNTEYTDSRGDWWQTYDKDSFPFGKNKSTTNPNLNIHLSTGKKQIPMLVDDEKGIVIAKGRDDVKRWLQYDGSDPSNTNMARNFYNPDSKYRDFWISAGTHGADTFDTKDLEEEYIKEYLDADVENKWNALEPSGYAYNSQFDIIKSFDNGKYKIISSNWASAQSGKKSEVYILDDNNNIIPWDSDNYFRFITESGIKADDKLYTAITDWAYFVQYEPDENTGFNVQPIFDKKGRITNDLTAEDFQKWAIDGEANYSEYGAEIVQNFENGVVYIKNDTTGTKNFYSVIPTEFSGNVERVGLSTKAQVGETLDEMINWVETNPIDNNYMKNYERYDYSQIYNDGVERYFENQDDQGNTRYGGLTPEQLFYYKNQMYPPDNGSSFDDKLAIIYNSDTDNYDYYMTGEVEGKKFDQLESINEEEAYWYLVDKKEYTGEDGMLNNLRDQGIPDYWNRLETTYNQTYDTNILQDDKGNRFYVDEDNRGRIQAYLLDDRGYRKNSYTYTFNKLGDQWMASVPDHTFEGSKISLVESNWTDEEVENAIGETKGERIWNPFDKTPVEETDNIINLGSKDNPDIFQIFKDDTGEVKLQQLDEFGRVVDGEVYSVQNRGDGWKNTGFEIISDIDGTSIYQYDNDPAEEEFFNQQSSLIKDDEDFFFKNEKYEQNYTDPETGISYDFFRNDNGKTYGVAVDEEGDLIQNYQEDGESGLYLYEVKLGDEGSYRLDRKKIVTGDPEEFDLIGTDWDKDENGLDDDEGESDASFTVPWNEVDKVVKSKGGGNAIERKYFNPNLIMDVQGKESFFHITENEDGTDTIYRVNKSGYRIDRDKNFKFIPDRENPYKYYNIEVEENGVFTKIEDVNGDNERYDREHIDNVYTNLYMVNDNFYDEDKRKQAWFDSEDDLVTINNEKDLRNYVQRYLDAMGYEFDQSFMEYIQSEMMLELAGNYSGDGSLGKVWTTKDIVATWDDNRERWMENDENNYEDANTGVMDEDQARDWIYHRLGTKFDTKYTDEQRYRIAGELAEEILADSFDRDAWGNITASVVDEYLDEKSTKYYDDLANDEQTRFNSLAELQDYYFQLEEEQGNVLGYQGSQKLITNLWNSKRGGQITQQEAQDAYMNAFRDQEFLNQEKLDAQYQEDWRTIDKDKAIIFGESFHMIYDDGQWIAINMNNEKVLFPDQIPQEYIEKAESGDYGQFSPTQYINAYNWAANTNHDAGDFLRFTRNGINLPPLDFDEPPPGINEYYNEIRLEDEKSQNIFDKFTHIPVNDLKESMKDVEDRKKTDIDQLFKDLENQEFSSKTIIKLIKDDVGIAFGEPVKNQDELALPTKVKEIFYNREETEIFIRSFLKGNQTKASNHALQSYIYDIRNDGYFDEWLQASKNEGYLKSYEQYKYEQTQGFWEKFGKNIKTAGAVGMTSLSALYTVVKAVDVYLRATILNSIIVDIASQAPNIRAVNTLAKMNTNGMRKYQALARGTYPTFGELITRNIGTPNVAVRSKQHVEQAGNLLDPRHDNYKNQLNKIFRKNFKQKMTIQNVKDVAANRETSRVQGKARFDKWDYLTRQTNQWIQNENLAPATERTFRIVSALISANIKLYNSNPELQLSNSDLMSLLANQERFYGFKGTMAQNRIFFFAREYLHDRELEINRKELTPDSPLFWDNILNVLIKTFHIKIPDDFGRPRYKMSPAERMEYTWKFTNKYIFKESADWKDGVDFFDLTEEGKREIDYFNKRIKDIIQNPDAREERGIRLAEELEGKILQVKQEGQGNKALEFYYTNVLLDQKDGEGQTFLRRFLGGKRAEEWKQKWIDENQNKFFSDTIPQIMERFQKSVDNKNWWQKRLDNTGEIFDWSLGFAVPNLFWKFIGTPLLLKIGENNPTAQKVIIGAMAGATVLYPAYQKVSKQLFEPTNEYSDVVIKTLADIIQITNTTEVQEQLSQCPINLPEYPWLDYAQESQKRIPYITNKSQIRLQDTKEVVVENLKMKKHNLPICLASSYLALNMTQWKKQIEDDKLSEPVVDYVNRTYNITKQDVKQMPDTVKKDTLLNIFNIVVNNKKFIEPRITFIGYCLIQTIFQYNERFNFIRERNAYFDLIIENFLNIIPQTNLKLVKGLSFGGDITIINRDKIAQILTEMARTYPIKTDIDRDFGEGRVNDYTRIIDWIRTSLTRIKNDFLPKERLQDILGNEALMKLTYDLGIDFSGSFENINDLTSLLYRSFEDFKATDTFLKNALVKLLDVNIEPRQLFDVYNSDILNPKQLLFNSLASQPVYQIEILNFLPITGFVVYEAGTDSSIPIENRLKESDMSGFQEKGGTENVRENVPPPFSNIPEDSNVLGENEQEIDTDAEDLADLPEMKNEDFEDEEIDLDAQDEEEEDSDIIDWDETDIRDDDEEEGIEDLEQAEIAADYGDWDKLLQNIQQSSDIYRDGNIDFEFKDNTLVLRGTQAPTSMAGAKEWLTNVNSKLVVFEEAQDDDVKVHQGFYDNFKKIYESKEFKKTIEEHIKTGKPLDITGHSRGGMTGTLIALALNQNYPELKIGDINIFSSAHVGNQALYDNINAEMININAWSVFGDPVVHLNFGKDYGDFKERIYINGEKEETEGYTEIEKRPRNKENDIDLAFTKKLINKFYNQNDRHGINHVKDLLTPEKKQLQIEDKKEDKKKPIRFRKIQDKPKKRRKLIFKKKGYKKKPTK